jgi:hypothetical protein
MDLELLCISQIDVKKSLLMPWYINVHLLLIEWLSNLRLVREPQAVIVHGCLGNIIFIIVFFRYSVVKLFSYQL